MVIFYDFLLVAPNSSDYFYYMWKYCKCNPHLSLPYSVTENVCVSKVTKVDGINSVCFFVFFSFAWQLLPTTYARCYEGYYREHKLIRWTDSQTVPRTHGGLPVLTRNVQITCKQGQIMWRFVILIVVFNAMVKMIKLSMELLDWKVRCWDLFLFAAVSWKKEKNYGLIVLLLIQPSMCFTFKNNLWLGFLLEDRFVNIRNPFSSKAKNY